MAQIKTNAAAAKRALQKQQAVIRRHKKEETTRRKDKEIRVRRLKAEIKALRRNKDLKLKRLRKAAAQRKNDRRIETARRLRQSTDKALNEFRLEDEAPTLRELVSIKRTEELKNGPYEYLVKAVIRVQNGSQFLTK